GHDPDDRNSRAGSRSHNARSQPLPLTTARIRPPSEARLSPSRAGIPKGTTVGEQERRAAPTPLFADATRSPSGIEFRSVLGLILECLESPWRRPCRPRLGYLRRPAEGSPDSLHHSRLSKQGPQRHKPAPTRTH